MQEYNSVLGVTVSRHLKTIVQAKSDLGEPVRTPAHSLERMEISHA